MIPDVSVLVYAASDDCDRHDEYHRDPQRPRAILRVRGLTADGTSLIVSDGTSTWRWRDSATFAEQKMLAVTHHGTPVTQFNELEWVKGEIGPTSGRAIRSRVPNRRRAR